MLKALKAGGFDIGRADGIGLFSQGSKAGETASFYAATDGLLIVCAPGAAMHAHSQNVPTEIALFIRRAKPGPGNAAIKPADPPADPLLDANIQPGEAKAYEVRAGQFIQIMDVQGRECTDFQCFSLAKLDQGIERDIKMTTTRSLTGCIYPVPGMMSKFWSADQEPLFEIVQQSRTGFSGELGYEVFCHPRDAEEVFDTIWKVGEPKGMIPLGLAALDMLRIEAGLIFAGSEFSDDTDPFEAGIGFTVPLKTQGDDFIGPKSIEKRKAHPHRKLVGLEIEAGLVPSHGDCLRIGNAQVGVARKTGRLLAINEGELRSRT